MTFFDGMDFLKLSPISQSFVHFLTGFVIDSLSFSNTAFVFLLLHDKAVFIWPIHQMLGRFSVVRCVQFEALLSLPILFKITRLIFFPIFLAVSPVGAAVFGGFSVFETTLKVIFRLTLTLLFLIIGISIIKWLPDNIFIFKKVARFNQYWKCIGHIARHHLRLLQLLLHLILGEWSIWLFLKVVWMLHKFQRSRSCSYHQVFFETL